MHISFLNPFLMTLIVSNAPRRTKLSLLATVLAEQDEMFQRLLAGFNGFTNILQVIIL